MSPLEGSAAKPAVAAVEHRSPHVRLKCVGVAEARWSGHEVRKDVLHNFLSVGAAPDEPRGQSDKMRGAIAVELLDPLLIHCEENFMSAPPRLLDDRQRQNVYTG